MFQDVLHLWRILPSKEIPKLSTFQFLTKGFDKEDSYHILRFLELMFHHRDWIFNLIDNSKDHASGCIKP